MRTRLNRRIKPAAVHELAGALAGSALGIERGSLQQVAVAGLPAQVYTYLTTPDQLGCTLS